VAAELNARPRKILGWDSPTVRLTYLASTSKQADLDHE
jgi:IS30 family transposase